MYMTRRERMLVELDPTLADRLRAAAREDQRRVRLVEQLDAAAARIAFERQACRSACRKWTLVRALEKYERLQVEAVRLGLITPERMQPA